MCGTISQPSVSEILHTTHVDRLGRIGMQTPGQLLRPGQNILALVEFKGQRILSSFHWGIFPDSDIAYNARIETAQTRPTWARLWTSKRAVVPVLSFKEGNKYARPSSKSILYLAALYNTFSTASGSTKVRTISIVTRPSIESLAQVHPRMPVVLPTNFLSRWLGEVPIDSNDVLNTKVPALEVDGMSVLTG